jgi:histidinol-phosphate/aromatic aminotransferase/cobyric acid decarboxylase-like protein/choline kinase
MNAIILAAGMGRRLKELTANNTKCMIKVNDITLIERMLRQLDVLNLAKIIIVIGYEGQKLRDFIRTLDIKTEIVYVNNPIYDRTNNIYSLSLARDYLLEDDALLLESDLILEDGLLEELIKDKRETLAVVDKYQSWMDGTVVKIDSEDNIVDFIPGNKLVFSDTPSYYKTVNIYKFSRQFSESRYTPFLDAYLKVLGNKEYYEQVLRVIYLLDKPGIKAKRLEGQLWYEIDDIQDLDMASTVFTENADERLASLRKRFGGCWRYPKLTDYCYLVNPYFPPAELVDEMQASFAKLMLQYPSGLEVNSLLAAKNFGVPQENTVVGNGASELIKALMEQLAGKVGIIRPTFEEYANRCDEVNRVEFIPDNEDFSYSSNDVISYFGDKCINSLVLINPDNPSGNYISKTDVLKIVKWANTNNINLIVDESFVDFSDFEGDSLINSRIVREFTNLIVVKSISKSYGVPGLRLGILVSGNEELIENISKAVAIWNINSFGEFFMQIVEKYSKDYEEALVRLRVARRRFVDGLNSVPYLRVVPSQANFVMCEVKGHYTAAWLTRELLVRYDVLIKDLSPKIHSEDGRQYVRITVRTEEENNLLVQHLRELGLGVDGVSGTAT